MRKVIGIGETVLDIIFKENKPLAAVPGGSVFNGIISLGRRGVKCVFISETGKDKVGAMTREYMRENGVSDECVSDKRSGQSPLSLAFLDEKNDADYTFYKDYNSEGPAFTMPEIEKDDIVMFGSYYAVNPLLRPQIEALLKKAEEKGAIVYYDVNFRRSHAHEVVKLMPSILDNFEKTTILRGSHEDFGVMFGKEDADRVFKDHVAFYCRNFIMTRGAESVELRTKGGVTKSYAVPQIETVSTIGAGDNFNAGLVFGLLQNNIGKDDLDRGLTEEQWDALIASATDFSSKCCQQIGNSI